MKKQKTLHFLTGQSWLVKDEVCRGCFIQENNLEFSPYLDPIFENKDFFVLQDAEWPVPGFYIVAIKLHLASIADLTCEQASMLGYLTYLTRRGMKTTLGIEHAQIYSEERLTNGHFHQWILPIWPNVSLKPKIYESNVKTYMDLFDFDSNKEAILACNKKMKKYFTKFKSDKKLA